MEALLVILFIVTILAVSGFCVCCLAAVPIRIAFEPGHPRPLFASLFVGILAIVTAQFLPSVQPWLSGQVKFILFPLLVASIAGLFAAKRAELDSVLQPSNFTPAANWVRDSLLVVGGIAGACLGAVQYPIGRTLLLSIGRGVLGKTPDEIFECRLAGALVGFFFGALLLLLIWSSLARRKPSNY
jgi:hypothetical protein